MKIVQPGRKGGLSNHTKGASCPSPLVYLLISEKKAKLHSLTHFQWGLDLIYA